MKYYEIRQTHSHLFCLDNVKIIWIGNDYEEYQILLKELSKFCKQHPPYSGSVSLYTFECRKIKSGIKSGLKRVVIHSRCGFNGYLDDFAKAERAKIRTARFKDELFCAVAAKK